MKTTTALRPVKMQISNDLQDIIMINEASTHAKQIRTIELSSLADIIPFQTAEKLRRQMLANKVEVQQLTNQVSFEAWTEVPSFVRTCMQIRFAAETLLPISLEVLIFDNTVAFYQLEPEVSITIIEHPTFATQQKALFDSFWQARYAARATR